MYFSVTRIFALYQSCDLYRILRDPAEFIILYFPRPNSLIYIKFVSCFCTRTFKQLSGLSVNDNFSWIVVRFLSGDLGFVRGWVPFYEMNAIFVQVAENFEITLVYYIAWIRNIS